MPPLVPTGKTEPLRTPLKSNLATVPEGDVECGKRGAMSSSWSLEKGKQPFERWPCIWRPDEAANPDIYQPYASLEVHVQRAFGLVAADVNTSDPYCKMVLNGEDIGQSTAVIRKTLAPIWNETFEIPIYHPLDIFTMTVYDQDFGTALGELDALGLDDDFLGWVDFPISKLPHNKKVHGWFELCPEDHFEDSLESRRRRKTTSNGTSHSAGHVYMSLKLKLKRDRDELFALMLGTPHFGEALPKLDVVTIFDSYLEAKTVVRIWQMTLMRIYSAFPKSPWIDAAVAVFLVWWPQFVPCVICLCSAGLTWRAWVESVRYRRNESGLPNASLIGFMNRSVRRAFSKRRAQKMTSSGLTEPLLATEAPEDSTTSSRTSPSATRSNNSRAKAESKLQPSQAGSDAKGRWPAFRDDRDLAATKRKSSPLLKEDQVVKSESEQKQDQATHDLGIKLAAIQPLIQGKDRLDMRRAQKVLVDVTQQLDRLQELVDEEANLFIVALVLSLTSLILALIQKWIGFIIQVCLTVIICVALLSKTIPGRIVSACIVLFSLSSSRRKLHFHIALSKDGEDSHKVQKEIARTLATLDGKPHRPSQDPHIQKGHPHQLVRKNYLEPTWCDFCGGFFWGVTLQGHQCKWCYRNFCKACKDHATDDTGPRNCGVSRPEGWEDDSRTETASNFSAGSKSTQGRR